MSDQVCTGRAKRGAVVAAVVLAAALAGRPVLAQAPERKLNAIELKDRLEMASRANDPEAIIHWGEQLIALLDSYRYVDQNLFQALMVVSNAYSVRGDEAKSLARLQRAEKVAVQLFGANSQNYAIVLFNKSCQLVRQGRSLEAGRLLERSRAITAKALGENHPALGNTCQMLATVHENLGDLVEAEELYLKALKIRQGGLPPQHPQLGMAYEGLGEFYRRKGDYDKALENLERAARIYLASLSARHPRSAQILVSIGIVHKRMGNYETAAKLMLAAVERQVASLGPDHPDVAMTLQSLGGVLSNVGEYDKASQFVARALEINTKARGENDRMNGPYHSDLGYQLTLQGKYDEAQKHMTMALGFAKREVPRETANYGNTLCNAAVLAFSRGQYDAACDYMGQSNRIYERVLRRVMGVGSESAKLAFLRQLVGKTQFAYHLALSSARAESPAAPALAELGMTVLLQRKGRVEDAMSACRSASGRLGAKQRAALEELISVRSQLARTSLGRGGAAGDVQALQDREAELERELSWAAARTLLVEPEVTVQRIAQALPADTLLVEYVLVRPFDPKVPKARESEIPQHYAVCTLARDRQPKWRDLGLAADVHRQLFLYRKAILSEDAPQVAKLGLALHQTLIAPLEAPPDRFKRLLLSPDGALNVLPFASLVDQAGKSLVERFELCLLSSGRDLLRMAAPLPPRGPAAVFADPDYDAADGSGQTLTGQRSRAQPKLKLNRLAGTANEAKALASLLADPVVRVRAEATEARLKALAGPAVLHVATHGFFLPDQQYTIVCVVAPDGSKKLYLAPADPENPLLRCGLALTGANRLSYGAEDGILTGMEVAGLDLQGTRLAVLSACQTALGDILPGEGVFGLRRALVVAGAQTQVISLWPVHDEATVELMKQFYTQLKAGAGRAEALRKAQVAMLAGKYKAPVYWAAFTISGDWRPLDVSGRSAPTAPAAPAASGDARPTPSAPPSLPRPAATGEREKKAASELRLAEAYLAAKMLDKARAIYQGVVRDYPGTEAARTAAEKLDQLKE